MSDADVTEIKFKIFTVTFSYSGSRTREYCTAEFKVASGDNLHSQIKEYVESQNKGEPPSDRIKYRSHKQKTISKATN